jgi:hypothetical protein
VASDYPGRTVLIAYFFENQEAGTTAEREQFSDELFDRFDAHIVAECATAVPPLDPSPRIRAAMAVMAQNAPGATNRIRARRAVEAYLTFRGF